MWILHIFHTAQHTSRVHTMIAQRFKYHELPHFSVCDGVWSHVRPVWLTEYLERVGPRRHAEVQKSDSTARSISLRRTGYKGSLIDSLLYRTDSSSHRRSSKSLNPSYSLYSAAISSNNARISTLSRARQCQTSMWWFTVCFKWQLKSSMSCSLYPLVRMSRCVLPKHPKFNAFSVSTGQSCRYW